MAILVLPFILISSTTFAQTEESCPLGDWAQNAVGAWNEGTTINNINCYRDTVTSMNMGRNLRDEVIAQFDTMFPRAGYKVVGLDPINAALPGVDRPMVGVMYVSMFLANGTILPLDSAEIIITEPDLILADEPTGSLDRKTANEIFSLFMKLKSKNRAILYATHNRELSNRADYKLNILDGNITRKNE